MFSDQDLPIFKHRDICNAQVSLDRSVDIHNNELVKRVFHTCSI